MFKITPTSPIHREVLDTIYFNPGKSSLPLLNLSAFHADDDHEKRFTPGPFPLIDKGGTSYSFSVSAVLYDLFTSLREEYDYGKHQPKVDKIADAGYFVVQCMAKIETLIRKYFVQILSLLRSLSSKGEHLYQTQKWAHQFSLSFEKLCSLTRKRLSIIAEASQHYAEKIPQLTEARLIITGNKDLTIKLFQQKIEDLSRQLAKQDTPKNQSNSCMKEQINDTKKQLDEATIGMRAAELVFDQEIAKIDISLQSITEAKRQLDATLIRKQLEVLVLYDSKNHPTGIPIKCQLLPLSGS